MKKIALLALLAFLCGCGGSSRPAPEESYDEAPDPSAVQSDWSSVDAFHAAFGSMDVRYPKMEIPAATEGVQWKGSGWRGERVSAQAVLWSGVDIDQVWCEFSDFKGRGGAMPASVAEARFVRYVLTDEFANGCGYRKPGDFPVSLVADALDNVASMGMAARTTQPLWLTLAIPADAAPGLYSGTLKIHADGQPTQKLALSIEVLPWTLPEPSEWVFHLDLWQHPAAVARVNGVELWSDAHWALLEKPMRMLAEAGQKVITTTMNKDPWNNQCYDAYDDMIRWTKRANGTWQYDYTVFDRWVELMMEMGVTKQINCYSMIPWNNELHYFDEASGQMVTVSPRPGSSAFAELWTPFLRSFREHLGSRGWLERTCIAMDERKPEDMRATLELLTMVAPEFGVALADNHHSYREYPFLRDICLSYGSTFDSISLQFRKYNDLISTFYVCCSHRFPNVFTFSDPAEATYIGWYATAAGFDGFLRWAYNSWTEDPFRDSRFRTWPAGDTYIIYPGGRSSIRFERLKEGIQDAEKIRILRQRFTDAGETDKLAQLERVLAQFDVTGIPEEACNVLVARGKRALEELSR